MHTNEIFARPLAQRNEIWETARVVKGEPATNADEIIDLSRAYSTDPTPDHITEAARAALDRGETHYVDRLGIKPLRQAIADTMARDGVAQVSVDDILVTSGAQEALFIILRSLMNPGDEILVPDPGYPMVEPLAQLASGTVIRVSTAADDWELKAERVRAALTERSRFLYVVSPNPATGRVVAADEFQKLIDLAQAHNLIVILDAALQKGMDAGVPRPHFTGGIPPQVLLVDSVSKFYRMDGWRIGWIAGNPAMLKPLRDLKQALSICSASISQWAAVAALTGPQEWLEEQQADMETRRDLVLQAVTASRLDFIRPNVPAFVWVDIQKTQKTSAEVAALLLEKAHVRVSAGTEFGDAGEGFIRISLAASQAELEAGMGRVRRALGELHA